MTDPRLTEARAAELWEEHVGDTVPWKDWYDKPRRAITSLLQAVFEAGREDDRSWEPLNGYKPRVGDEVRQDYGGVTSIAFVGRVDEDGDPWTAENRFIGALECGTWYVRYDPKPPFEYDGAILVPADGHEVITTTDGQEFSRLTFTTKQSLWYGPNLAARPGDWVIQTTTVSRLTPNTWKVASDD